MAQTSMMAELLRWLSSVTGRFVAFINVNQLSHEQVWQFALTINTHTSKRKGKIKTTLDTIMCYTHGPCD